MLAWAASLGSLQAATVGLRQSFLDELTAFSSWGAPPLDTMSETLMEAATVPARELPRLGVAAPSSAIEELRDVALELDMADSGRPGGLVPGDTCPSNAIETDDGLVLLDFEGAEYRHVAWEAAYLTVPWTRQAVIDANPIDLCAATEQNCEDDSRLPPHPGARREPMRDAQPISASSGANWFRRCRESGPG